MGPRIVVVILNWNGWRDTIECLASIYHVSYEPFFVIVVDNASTDASIRRLREYCEGQVEIQSRFPIPSNGTQPPRMVEYTREEAESVSGKGFSAIDPPSRMVMTLIRNERNYGFAEGNNIGMRFALSTLDPEYILLLNNDTVVDQGFLSELVAVGESNKRFGIIGPKILYYDFNGRSDVIWYAGGRIDPLREWVFYHLGVGEEDRGQYDSVAETEWCTGAAFLLKKELARVALLNPAYPFGSEDVEYCMNARKRGYKVVYVPSAKVWHKVGASRAKVDNRIRRDIADYFLFIRRNFPTPVYLYHLMLFFVTVLPRWATAFVLGDRDRRAFDNFVTEGRKLAKYFLQRWRVD